jgi:antitoxin Phd
MQNQWPLQDAKNRFSELVDTARTHGPQTIMRRGKKTAVILSLEDFQTLTCAGDELVGFFAKSPLKGVKLDFERSSDTGREVKL